MKNDKKDVIQFFVWMRNGIAFCTSWLLILWLFYNHFYHIENIATDSLIKMLFFVVGAVFIFSLSFTRFMIKKWSFPRRLNCFMILISIYECVAFYCTGFWKGSGTPAMWIGFMAIILISYLLCIVIYQRYSKKQGELYTQALKNYQSKRSAEYGK